MQEEQRDERAERGRDKLSRLSLLHRLIKETAAATELRALTFSGNVAPASLH